jgi:glyoxylase-like metal-dependent hydrolase (beta-lactamase superfamily II)
MPTMSAHRRCSAATWSGWGTPRPSGCWRDNDPARPVPLPDVTFETHRTLHVGGERIDLAWHGTNHTPDNIYIHFPDHDTLMLVDILLPGWAPYNSFNVNEDVSGSVAAPVKAMAYPWKHFIGGHMGRLGTRDDMAVYQRYVSDLIDNIKKAHGKAGRPAAPSWPLIRIA